MATIFVRSIFRSGTPCSAYCSRITRATTSLSRRSSLSEDGTDQLHCSLENIRNATRRSGADAFIEKWKNQYDQMLGRQFTDGVEPSKGQMQKLALARSFYRDPRIMIMDEPTSSIDAEAESRIFEQLDA